MPPLRVLRRKLRKRLRQRNRQTRKIRETGLRGHHRARKRHSRAVRYLRRLIRKARRERLKRAWGGSKWIVRREVWPVVRDHGIRRTSAKRRETFGNPGSDHFIGNRKSYAEDYATASNYALADEIGRALGVGNVSDYTHYFIHRRGHVYRVQVIAGTHGTGPHLHVGVRRVT